MEYLGWFMMVVSILELLVAMLYKRDLFAKRIYRFVLKLISIDPYKLEGKTLSFKNLSNMIKSGEFSSKGTCKLAFITGSCRSRSSPGTHTALCTDLTYTPEIAVQFYELCEGKIEVATLFDIDVDNTYKENWNLIVTGGGNINTVMAEIVDYYGEKLRVRPTTPTGLELIGLADEGQKLYTPEESPRVGALILCVNPWAARKKKKRIVIITFGTAATGTMAALQVLYEYLKYPDKAENNLLDPTIPSRVVKAELKSYGDPLKSQECVIPSFDVRSVKKAICIE